MGRTAAAPTPAPADELSRPSLRTVVDRLHPAVLDVAVAPRGLDVPVADPVILDTVDDAPVEADAIALCVGISGEREQVTALRRMGAAAVAAVVIKRTGTLAPAVIDAATEEGVAVLVAPAALSWGQLYTLLLTATRSTPPVSEQVEAAPLGDLFALANAIAAAVGGATTIEDPTNRVLAYSNLDHPIDPARQETILGRQVPSPWIQRLHDAGVFRRLWQSEEVVRIDDFTTADVEYLPRVAVAVRAAGELLGSIWVIEGRTRLGAEAERALRDAAGIAALHLLRHRAAGDVDRRRRTDSLLALLDGAAQSQVAGEILAIAADRPTVVAALSVTVPGDTADASGVVAAQRVADLAAIYCESYRRRAACAATGDRVYLLVPVDADTAAAPVVALAEAVVERAERALRLTVRCGLSGIAPTLDDVPAARREADQVLEIVTRSGGEAVGSIERLRAQVVLHRLVGLAEREPGLTDGRVSALAEQDATKGTSWIPTLRAYFDAFGDMASAAAAVNIHPNTFRYRLRRITDVFGLDLDDPDERLVAELQLRFLEHPHS